MTSPADDARRDLGLPLSGSTPSRSGAAPRHLQPIAGSGHGNPLRLIDIANGATPKSRAVIQGLGALTRCSWLALLCAVAVAAGHRSVLSFAADTSLGFVTEWAVAALTFASAPLWAPWAAGATAVVLVGLACVTRGFTRANTSQMICLAAADVVAMVLAVPVAFALTAGAVVVALVVVAALAALALALAMLAAG